MRAFVLLVVLACSACVAPVPMPGVGVPFAPPAVVEEPDCRDFSTPVVVNGRAERAHGTACLQPDGSWRIKQSIANAPPQIYVTVPHVYRPYYPPPYWSNRWFYGPPLFLGHVFIGGGWGYAHPHPGWHGAWGPRRRWR